MRDCGLLPFAKCRGYTIRDEKAKGRWCVERDIVVVYKYLGDDCVFDVLVGIGVVID